MRLNIKIAFLFVCLIIVIYNHVNCQSYQIKNLPVKYNIPVENVDLKVSSDVMTDELWEVYSDREYIRSTENPGSGSMKQTLEYLHRYYVVEEKGNYIRIINDPHPDFSGFPSPESEDYGWVKKEDVLLWKHCVVSENNFTQKKCLIFKHKTTQIFFNSDDFSNFKFRILYVYKEENNSLLLGIKPFIISTDDNITQSVIGWVPKEKIIEWNNNLAIEPNYNEKAIEERRSKLLDVKIFYEITNAKAYSRGKKPLNNTIAWSEKYTERNQGSWLRFPFLSGKKNIVETVHYEFLNTNPQHTTSDEADQNFKGYSSIVNKNINSPMFKQVILVNRNELFVIIESLQKLIKAYGDNEVRDNLISTLKEIIRERYLGPSELLNELNLNQITFSIFGASNINSKISNYSLAQLSDPALLNNEQLISYEEDLKVSEFNLTKILNENSYFYSFSMNDMIYYWIPCDFLP